jgi:hypothetical protein
MIDNRAFGSLLFRGVDSVGVAGGEVHTAVCGYEGKSDGVFRKEVV